MSEDVPSFIDALNIIKKSRSVSGTNQGQSPKEKDKIVYEIPDMDEVSQEEPQKIKKTKSYPPSEASQIPSVPPRPQEKKGKYTHKAVLPTPVDAEQVEKRPIRLTVMPKYLGKSFTVTEFADKFRGQFPIAVKVSRGFYGDNELYTLSEGEKFVICFLTDYKTVCGVDPNGSIFEIPVNESHLVSLLSERLEFDPRTQESIPSLLSLNPTPKRVAARNNFTRNGVTVKIGDLLQIISINYDEDNGQPLNVIFRTREGKDVVLTEHDTEQFSLRLSLTSEKMEQAIPKCNFPQRVYLYPQCNNKYTSNNKPYTLLEMRDGQMLVSYVYEDKITYVGVDETDDALVEIPLDLDIELQILGKPENKVYETKEEIYSAYKDVRKFIRKEEDYGTIADYVRKGKNVELPSTKSSPGMAFLRGLSAPNMVQISPPIQGPPNHVPRVELNRLKKDLCEERKRNAELERMALKLDEIIKGLNQKCEQKERYIKELLAERDLPPLPQTGQQQRRDFPKDNPEYYASSSENSLYTQVDENKYSEPRAISLRVSVKSDKSIFTEKKLDDYTVQEVRELLDSLNLSQYTDRFVEEGVNGEILSVLDGPILENDLGVVSGLHKKKILKIIEKLNSQQDISHYMSIDSIKSPTPQLTNDRLYQAI